MTENTTKDYFQRILTTRLSQVEMEPLIDETIVYYRATYEALQGMLNGTSKNVIGSLPVLTERTYTAWREVGAIVGVLEARLEQIMQTVRDRLMNAEGKVPAVSIIEKTAENDPVAVQWRNLIMAMALMRDRFTGLVKAFDVLHAQTKNLG